MAVIRSRILLLAFLSLASCKAEEEESVDVAALPQSACSERQFEGSRFTICPFDSSKQDLKLFVADARGQPLRSFKALEAHLGSAASSLRFAMNAGMYDEAGQPIGLYVEGGKKLHELNLREGSGNFHLLPNGVFAIGRDGGVSVRTSSQYAAAKPDVLWASQSGPMLVIDGKLHPEIDPNGESLHIRNGVGACGPKTAQFVISEEPVSFGRLARLFKDELGCPNALYLDGAVSSLWEAGVRQDDRSELGPLVAVFRRSP